MTVVGMNLLWARPGRVGGSEDYLVRQLIGLGHLQHEFDVTTYVVRGFTEAHPELSGTRTAVAPGSGRARPARVVLEHTWLARRARRDQVALMHHGGGTVPALGPGPVVLTIHDLQWRDLPHYVSDTKLRYLRWATPRSVGRASVITTPTEFVKRTVVEAYGVDEARVIVVRHGLEPTIGVGATDEATLRARYRLGTAPIVVYPAMTHPHKRHDFLVELIAGPWADVVLVLPGAAGSADAELQRRIDALGVGHRVVRPGRVPAADRDGLVAMAVAVALPSEYEGFGAPALEAMALGTPLISSDRAALPEVVGDAGLVLPLEIEAWAGALDTIATRRADLVAAGRSRVTRYTSRQSAGDLLTAYRLALS